MIEEHDFPESAIEFDESGTIRAIDAPGELLERVTENGVAFMTDGCPDREENGMQSPLWFLPSRRGIP